MSLIPTIELPEVNGDFEETTNITLDAISLPAPAPNEVEEWTATHYLNGKMVEQRRVENKLLYFGRDGRRVFPKSKTDRAVKIKTVEADQSTYTSPLVMPKIFDLSDLLPKEEIVDEPVESEEEFSPELIGLCLEALKPGRGYAVDPGNNAAKMIDARTVRLSVYKGIETGGSRHFLITMPESIKLTVKILEY